MIRVRTSFTNNRRVCCPQLGCSKVGLTRLYCLGIRRINNSDHSTDGLFAGTKLEVNMSREGIMWLRSRYRDQI